MADNWSNKQEGGHASHRRSGSSLRSKSSRPAVGLSRKKGRRAPQVAGIPPFFPRFFPAPPKYVFLLIFFWGGIRDRGRPPPQPPPETFFFTPLPALRPPPPPPVPADVWADLP